MPQQENKADNNARFRRDRPGWCSFCRRHYRDVGPIVEGPDFVFICFKCIEVSTQALEDECRHLGKALPCTSKAEREKGTDQGEGIKERLLRLENRATAWWQSVRGDPEIEKSLASTTATPQKEGEGETGGTLRRCYPGWCSFCRRHHREVGPLVEGADYVYVCYECIESCRQIIENACLSTGAASPWTFKAEKEQG
jgi:ClpX C4-type zinc finger